MSFLLVFGSFPFEGLLLDWKAVSRPIFHFVSRRHNRQPSQEINTNTNTLYKIQTCVPVVVLCYSLWLVIGTMKQSFLRMDIQNYTNSVLAEPANSIYRQKYTNTKPCKKQADILLHSNISYCLIIPAFSILTLPCFSIYYCSNVFLAFGKQFLLLRSQPGRQLVQGFETQIRKGDLSRSLYCFCEASVMAAN